MQAVSATRPTSSRHTPTAEPLHGVHMYTCHTVSNAPPTGEPVRPLSRPRSLWPAPRFRGHPKLRVVRALELYHDKPGQEKDYRRDPTCLVDVEGKRAGYPLYVKSREPWLNRETGRPGDRGHWLDKTAATAAPRAHDASGIARLFALTARIAGKVFSRPGFRPISMQSIRIRSWLAQ